MGVRRYLNLKTYEQYSPRERNDLRGKKFTAPINRTKTYLVNRRSQGNRHRRLLRQPTLICF